MRFDDWSNSELIHYNIKGSHWGIRRYQNKDGSLTPLGYEHYYGHRLDAKGSKRLYKDLKYSGRVSRMNNKFAKNHADETDLGIRIGAAIARNRSSKMNTSIKELKPGIIKELEDKQLSNLSEREKLLDKNKGATRHYERMTKEYRKLSSQIEKASLEYANSVLGTYARKRVYDISGQKKVKAAEAFVQRMMQ